MCVCVCIETVCSDQLPHTAELRKLCVANHHHYDDGRLRITHRLDTSRDIYRDI